MKDPLIAMTAMIRAVPPTGLVREHEVISKFLQEIKGKHSYIKRVEIAMAAQDRIKGDDEGAAEQK